MSARFTTTANTLNHACNTGWFHWAVIVRNRTTYEFYINGVLQQNLTKSYKFTGYAGTLKYGAGGTAGQTDELRILNAAPTADWVKAEYDSVNNTQFITASAAMSNSSGISIIVR